MKVEIWSDYVCPFCYIGERKLELALKETGIYEETEIIFNSFELDPSAKERYEGNIDEIMAKKYGMSLAQAKATNDNIVASAKEVGLNYNFDDLKPTNTFDAHRLSHYAKELGKLREYTEVVMKKYFIESELISSTEVLLNAIDEIGLDRERAIEILNSDEYGKQVREDEQKAYNKGINGVPYFVFNDEQAVYGAQPVDVFVNVINALHK